MELTEQSIRQLVTEVVKQLDLNVKEAGTVSGSGIFPDIDSAVQAAKTAHQELTAMKLETRGRLVAAMRDVVVANLDVISGNRGPSADLLHR